MNVRTALILTVTLLLTACASGRFVKPGATAEDWSRDTYACERDVRQVAYSFGGGIGGAIEARGMAMRCMTARGWSYVEN